MEHLPLIIQLNDFVMHCVKHTNCTTAVKVESKVCNALVFSHDNLVSCDTGFQLQLWYGSALCMF